MPHDAVITRMRSAMAAGYYQTEAAEHDQTAIPLDWHCLPCKYRRPAPTRCAIAEQYRYHFNCRRVRLTGSASF